MTVGPIGDLAETSTSISQQAQLLADRNAQQAQVDNATQVEQDQRAADDAQALQAQQSQQTILDRVAERQAQLEAEQEAQERADAIQAQLEAVGIQRAQLQDEILADRDLQATQEAVANQNTIAQQSLDQAAVNSLLNNSTVNDPQEAIDEFQQMQLAEVSVTATFTHTGSAIDTRL